MHEIFLRCFHIVKVAQKIDMRLESSIFPLLTNVSQSVGYKKET